MFDKIKEQILFEIKTGLMWVWDWGVGISYWIAVIAGVFLLIWYIMSPDKKIGKWLSFDILGYTFIKVIDGFIR